MCLFAWVVHGPLQYHFGDYFALLRFDSQKRGNHRINRWTGKIKLKTVPETRSFRLVDFQAEGKDIGAKGYHRTEAKIKNWEIQREIKLPWDPSIEFLFLRAKHEKGPPYLNQ